MGDLIVLVGPRFDPRVRRGEGCWEWTGEISTDGYGKYWQDGRSHGAHRIAYQFIHGPLASSIYVCHTCDNRKCVRPDHLFAGTAADNNRDMWAKGRGVTNGKPLPGESNPQAILTEHEVQAIRRLVTENVPQRVVASAFGVSPSAVSDIIRGDRWKKT